MDRPLTATGVVVVIGVLVVLGLVFGSSSSPSSQLAPPETSTTSVSQTIVQPKQTGVVANDLRVGDTLSAQEEALNTCVAKQVVAYEDPFILKTCAQFGYTKEDYDKGLCQLPFPDVSQVMLIKRQQEIAGISACEAVYGP